MTFISRFAILVTTLLVLLNPGLSQAFPRYKITPIPPISPLVTTHTLGMASNAGYVVGFGLDKKVHPQGFRWRAAGPIQLIPPLGKDQASRATAVNDRGDVVGWSGYADSSAGTAFVWDGINQSALPLLPGYHSSRADGINNRGRVVGFSHSDSHPLDQATIWDGGMASLVGTGQTGSGRILTSAWGVNQAGRIVGGTNDLSSAGKIHAFYWDGDASGDAVDLPEPDGAILTSATAVNDHGQVIGNAFTTSGQPALFWDKNHRLYEIPPLPGDDENTVSIPRDINNAGWVVGKSDHGPWVWHAAEGIALLHDLLVGPDLADWDLGTAVSGAFGIDNRGRISGSGIYRGVETAFILTPVAERSPLRVGWAVGLVVDKHGDRIGATILHTRNGGRKWVEQGDRSRWLGYQVHDVSAVDRRTAWVAMGDSSSLGIILHTANGGATWTEQTLPKDVDDIKGIKGLSRHDAWAVSFKGTILHTTDGGKIWNIVDPLVPIIQVNRMDAIGSWDTGRAVPPRKKRKVNANIWIVDEHGGNWGMIHSLDNGKNWRQEYVPFPPSLLDMHMVSAYSPKVVWAAAWGNGTLFRTVDGGENWKNVASVGGANDLDDMCSPSADTVWTVQNQSGGSSGIIYHVRLRDGGEFSTVLEFNPLPGYQYEGMTCVDDLSALVVGYRGYTVDQSEPIGIIVSTTDGGQNWTRHSIPVDDVELWKTSFVGARR